MLPALRAWSLSSWLTASTGSCHQGTAAARRGSLLPVGIQLCSAIRTSPRCCLAALPRGDSPPCLSLLPALLQAENIMFLELDVSPPAVFEFERSRDPAEQDPRALHLERLMHLDSLLERPAASRVRKSRSW